MRLRIARRYHPLSALPDGGLVLVLPELLQVILEHIHGRLGPVGPQQLGQPDPIPRVDVLPVAQQQPPGALHHGATRLVGRQSVGLVHADAVHDLPPILHHDVEQVLDDLGVGALVAYLLREGLAHVHDRRLDPGPALLAKRLEEGAQVLAAPATTHPEHLPAAGLDHDGRVAVPLLDRELVHGDDLQAPKVRGTERLLEASLVDLLDGGPVQAEVLRHVLERKHPGQPCNALGQTARHPLVAPQPVQVLDLGTAARASQAAPVNQENHGRPQEWQVTDPPLLGVMDRIDGLETTTANLGPPRGRAELEPNLQTSSGASPSWGRRPKVPGSSSFHSPSSGASWTRVNGGGLSAVGSFFTPAGLLG